MFSIKLEGNEELEKSLTSLSESFKDFRECFSVMVKSYEDHMEAQFRTRGEGKWRPLSPYTIRAKKRKGYPLDPLVATGRLRRSLVGRTDDTVRRGEKDKLVLGSKVPYTKFHQKGTRRMPKRELITAELTAKLAGIAEKYVKDA